MSLITQIVKNIEDINSNYVFIDLGSYYTIGFIPGGYQDIKEDLNYKMDQWREKNIESKYFFNKVRNYLIDRDVPFVILDIKEDTIDIQSNMIEY